MSMAEPFPEVEKIRIVLAEHSTLRAELVARFGHAYQMIGYGVAAIVLLTALKPSAHVFWFMLSLVLFIFGFALWVYWRDILKAGRRIREIELDINSRAKEDLLVWENLWGAGSVGFFGPGHPLPRSHLANVKCPVRTWRGTPIAPSEQQTQARPI
jgi:hypothetical protein